MSHFTGYYDPDRKLTTDRKIDGVIQAYIRKWESAPSLILVSESDYPQITPRDDIEVRPVRHVAQNCFFVGHDFESVLD